MLKIKFKILRILKSSILKWLFVSNMIPFNLKHNLIKIFKNIIRVRLI